MRQLQNIGPAGILFCSLLFLGACVNDMKEVEALTQKAGLVPTESSTNLHVIYSDSGLLDYRLSAAQMDHYVLGVKEPYAEFPKGGYVEGYDHNNKVKTTMSANYGIRYDVGHVMEKGEKTEVYDSLGKPLNTDQYTWAKLLDIKNKVEIVNEKGERLNTEHLAFVQITNTQDNTKQTRILSDTYLEVKTAKEIIRGTGLVANEDFSEWEIRNVSGTIPVDEKEFKKD
jgi:lipopolysaccharide export system protein LptC